MAVSKEVFYDTGSGEIFASILNVIVSLGLIYGGIDVFLFFSNASSLETIATTGARTISIFGGNGTYNTATPLERAYGQLRGSLCNNSKITGRYVDKARAFTGTSTPTECALMGRIDSSTELVNVRVDSVTCTPTFATNVGQEVSCTIMWEYNPIVFKPMKLFNFGSRQSDGSLILKETKGIDVSEVMFSYSDMVSR